MSPPGYADGFGNDSIYIVKSGSGYTAYALSCARDGCLINPYGSGWLCPCHNTSYDANGLYTGGPSGGNLQHYATCADANGVTVVLT